MGHTFPTMPTEDHDLFAAHRLNLAAVEGGKWVKVGDDKFQVASYSAKGVATERAAAMAELGLPADAEVPAHKIEFVQEWIFSRAILRGCKLAAHPGVTYKPEIGARIYSDPELVNLRSAIQAAALGDYTKDEVAKAAILGNS